jgi:hypothetical protein
MKKVVYCVFAVVVIAAAGVNVKLGQSEEFQSTLTLKNINALAVPTEELVVTRDYSHLYPVTANYTIRCNGQTITPVDCETSGCGCTRRSCLVDQW